MEDFVEILVPIAFFAMLVLIVYFTARYNHQTKMAILEKGGNLDTTRRKFPFLELGLTLLGVGLGLIISLIIQSFHFTGDKDILTGACVLLFGGAGLVSAFFIRRKLEKQQG